MRQVSLALGKTTTLTWEIDDFHPLLEEGLLMKEGV
jgi:hypothetical protein